MAQQKPQYAEMPAAPTGPSYPNNWMGIVALIAPLVGFAIVGVVMGHLGLDAVKRGQADNRGLALAGLIISYIYVALTALVIIGYFVFAAVIATVAIVEDPGGID